MFSRFYFRRELGICFDPKIKYKNKDNYETEKYNKTKKSVGKSQDWFIEHVHVQIRRICLRKLYLRHKTHELPTLNDFGGLTLAPAEIVFFTSIINTHHNSTYARRGSIKLAHHPRPLMYMVALALRYFDRPVNTW